MTRGASKTMRLATAAAATFALLVAGGATSAPASAAANLVVQFQRLNTPLCVTENMFSNPQLFETVCNTGDTRRQRWIMFNLPGHPGTKFISQSVPSVCLNVEQGSKQAGARIVLSECASDLSQDWLITSTPRLAFLIENANSRQCMTRTSVAFVQQPCSPSLPEQNFLLNAV
jgi:hypothetical protein